MRACAACGACVRACHAHVCVYVVLVLVVVHVCARAHAARARGSTHGIEPRFLRVEHEGAPLLSGELFAEIKVDDSTWLLSGGILTVSLLKSNRRGHYKKGTNNADTFWRSLVTNETNEGAVLAIEHVPKKYFFCEYDKEDEAGTHRAIRAGDKRR